MFKSTPRIYFIYLIYTCCFAGDAFAQSIVSPKVLIVIAHPDDETAFAGTVYKIAKEMHGTVDLACITNGEGGYKYSTLAEAYYGLELTNEAIGRENLPRIRKRELMNAGNIIGIHDFFFLDQKDAHYGLDEKEPLDTSWDVRFVLRRLHQVMTTTHYDFLFCLLPVPGTHGGHKAATLLALRAVLDMPIGSKPIILGASAASKGDTLQRFSFLTNHFETSTLTDTASFKFDRTVAFGYNKQLNYKVITNWEIAEHKSQGTMQLAMNKRDYETFWFFKQNDPADFAKAKQLFEALKFVPYPSKTYK